MIAALKVGSIPKVEFLKRNVFRGFSRVLAGARVAGFSPQSAGAFAVRGVVNQFGDTVPRYPRKAPVSELETNYADAANLRELAEILAAGLTRLAQLHRRWKDSAPVLENSRELSPTCLEVRGESRLSVSRG